MSNSAKEAGLENKSLADGEETESPAPSEPESPETEETEPEAETKPETASEDEEHDAALRAQYDHTHEVAAAGGDNGVNEV